MTSDRATFATLRHTRPDYGAQLELALALAYHHVVTPGATVVDGGANTGLHSLALARLVGPEGHVLCFEPVPRVAADLVRHLAEAGLLSRCSIHAQALWHERALLPFVVDEGNTALSHLRRPGESAPAAVAVPAVRLDDVVGQSPVRFVKLDLEGADIQGIEGAAGVLRRSRPPLAFECGRPRGNGRRQGRSRGEFLGFFASLDYALYDLHGRPLDAGTWDDDDMSFELLAWPGGDDRLAGVLALLEWFWGTVAERPVATWRDCWEHCRDPLAYLRALGCTPPA